ncbi:Hydroxyacyl-coenzyme A dehydrogenase, mitochondrial [Penicillium subrubescens]|uniref:Hydroxyacyl-coenzyme A dehydrogenase, mitochondrial n=2 Tax=Penicillium subrubescens TaxID=1316194 RepID=A0A1Q5URX8_9EURO|nr:Hydroxyacyl-coenzyme A dehydrogenase, mitochondrial [Penicillium subrubescens]
MTWTPVIEDRPISILGAGFLGRRIACVFVAAGYVVHIYDPSADALEAAAKYIDLNKAAYAKFVQRPTKYGLYSLFLRTADAVCDAWLAVEAIPEDLQLKIETLGTLDEHAPEDCIFASNSSSFRSSLMLDKVTSTRRKQILNMHFYIPPTMRAVELMTDGETHTEIFPFLVGFLESCGMLPVVVKKESTGFIFNRLWAAIKREILLILAEGISEPREIDLLWDQVLRSGPPPCKLMDEVGLDTVAFVEDTYIRERRLDGKMTVKWLWEHYLRHGRLGNKAREGGLYSPTKKVPCPSDDSPVAYLIDVGIGANLTDLKHAAANGKLLSLTAHGEISTLVTGLRLPDSVGISKSTSRIFWTCMGSLSATADGCIMSARLDGSDVRIILQGKQLYTPKQLVVEEISQKLYFCDREGMSVHRCNFDGQAHEVLVSRGACPNDQLDMKRWCVGIAVDIQAGVLYWTQKGPSKAGQGRIFRANIEIPAAESPESRTDIETLLEDLPEPIDLEIDSRKKILYWTDRGEHPKGCSLNSASVDGETSQIQKSILARNFHEPVGLKLDAEQEKIYLTDLGGSVYRVNLDGSGQEILVRDGGCYTGISLVGSL